MMTLELSGARYRLDTAAISAVRYRAAWGESIVDTLGGGLTRRQLEGKLLRMCHLMIPPADRPELAQLARQARRDGHFLAKALRARDALLSPDPALEGWEEDGGGASASRFDEYKLLAALTLAGVDLRLMYELPVLHLAGLIRRLNVLQDPERKTYRPLGRKEMAQLYPRPKKKAAPAGGKG